MSVRIRPATLADVASLVRLNAVVQQLHLDQRPDQFAPATPSDVTAWFRGLLPQAHCSAWIAECDALVVGYLLGLVHSRAATPFSPPRSWFEVDQLAVDPTYRNRGVGSALLAQAITSARENQIGNVELTTWAFNAPAESLFAKLGFVRKHVRLELSSTKQSPNA